MPMLIKHPDDPTPLLEALKARAAGQGTDARAAARELQRRQAGIRGEQQTRYLIDFEFARSNHWAVLHDLRVEHQGLVAQIDHVLVNRLLDVYVLETKHVHAGIKITADGEFLRWNAYRKTYKGMPSPLQQNQRHIQVLSAVMRGLRLPERLGLRLAPSFHSVVLVAPHARIDRSRHFDSSRVVKSDQLRQRINRDIDEESPLRSLASVTRLVSSQTLADLAGQLARCHRPAAGSIPVPTSAPASGAVDRRTRQEPRPGIPPDIPRPPPPLPPVLPPPPSDAAHPAPAALPAARLIACKSCADAQGQVLYGKYGYYFKCARCGGNSAIRLRCRPGHQPRLRKSGNHFHRDCPQCGSSERVFSNG